MNPAPRPAARLLLAGRFLASRASLLALPEGPVTGLDLATGDLVGLAFGPGASDPAALVSRIDTWNELALPGCPPVRELCRHLGRPLVSFELRPLPCMPVDLDGALVAARCGALGEQLARAGLGLPAGPADLGLGAAGPLLRRPAIWPHDDERPLGAELVELASRLLVRAPGPVVEPVRTRRVRPALARRLPRSRSGRLVLVAACAALLGLVASSLTSSSNRGAVADAAPLALAPPAPAAAPPPPHRQLEVRRRVAPPGARGGPARLLLRAPPPAAPATPRVPPARPAATGVADPPVTRGWVEGLFVGS